LDDLIAHRRLAPFRCVGSCRRPPILRRTVRDCW